MTRALNDIEQQIHDTLNRFEQILEQEFDAIRGRDPAALEGIVNDKQGVIDALSQLTESYARTAGIKTKSDTFEALPDDIQARLRRCHNMNRTNGAAIQASQRFLRSLLDILRGRANGGETYTASGELGAQSASSGFARV